MVFFFVDMGTIALTPSCLMLEETSQVANLSCPKGFKMGKDTNETIIMTFATAGWYLLVGNWLSSIRKAGIKGKNFPKVS